MRRRDLVANSGLRLGYHRPMDAAPTDIKKLDLKSPPFLSMLSTNDLCSGYNSVLCLTLLQHILAVTVAPRRQAASRRLV